MKLGQDCYALVTEEGVVAGDGESPCIHSERQFAQNDLDNQSWREYLERVNRGSLRVARVRLVEVPEPGCSDHPPAA